MSYTQQEVLESFWLEVLHRAKMLLSDMNVGSFYQWRETVGDKKINHLLKLMELLLCSESDRLEINFLMKFIIEQLHGPQLFSCFKISGKKLIKEGIKGDVYCMPVLYVLINYLINNEKTINSVDFDRYQELQINQVFKFIPEKTD